MRIRAIGLFFALGLLLPSLGSVSAKADVDQDKIAIAQRLHLWADAFNTRDIAGVCDLFSSDLISSVPGAIAAGRDEVCTRLANVLAKPNVTLRYRPQIDEIIVSGDIAVVRLIWELTTERGSDTSTSREVGMDIFQREPSGQWSIIRFLAFSFDPAI